MGTVFYFVKEAFRGMFAAKLMTFVSIITIGASLFFMTLIGLGIYNINGLLKQTEKQSDIAVYLKDDFSGDKKKVASLTSQISSYPQVKKIEFVSKDSALSKFVAIYGSEMLDAVSGNPLPASIEVYVVDRYRVNSSIRELQEKMQRLTGVESVRYSREWIDLVERFRVYFYTGAAIFALVMLLVLHIMISNTIKLTIYARRELVKNMHLVGATRFFINTPFILEGMVQGGFGACVSVIALTLLKLSLVHIPLLWGPDSLLGFILFTGVFFGWIGSLSAVRKFMV
jgi:cell division transport system permease protein